MTTPEANENMPTFNSRRKTDSATISEDGASASDALSGAHLDDIVFDETAAIVDDPDAPLPVGDDGVPIMPDAEPERLDKAAFYTTLKLMFELPGFYDSDFKPLAIQDGEEDGARAASDAIYSLLEIWYPAALVPQSETLGHLMVAVPFLALKVKALRDILAEKRAGRAASTFSPMDLPDNLSGMAA